MLAAVFAPVADSELARKALAGDQAAFTALFHAHRNDVYRVARAITQSDVAALDVAQDAFIKVYQRLSTWQGNSSLKTWILRIAIRCALDYRRRNRRTQPLGKMDIVVDPSPALHRALLVQRVLQLATQLPGRPGLVLKLRLLGGLSNREIAESLGLTEANVRVQLSRSVKRLRELL